MTRPTHTFAQRERQVAELLLADKCGKEIAGRLILSRLTVKKYCERIRERTGCSSSVVAAHRIVCEPEQVVRLRAENARLRDELEQIEFDIEGEWSCRTVASNSGGSACPPS